MRAALALLLALAAAAGAAERGASEAERAAALFKEGMAAKMRGDTSTALDRFSAALALNESLPGARLARGLTAVDAMLGSSRMELQKSAEQDLGTALEQAPKSPLALCALALVKALNRDRGGEALVNKAAALRDALPAYGYAASGRYRLDDEDYKGAVAAYRKAFEASRHDAPMREWLRRELGVVRDRIRLKRVPVAARLPEPEPEVKFDAGAAIAELADADPTVRAAAARSLGRPELEEAVEPLCALLKDADLEVRAVALASLGRIGLSRAVKQVAPLLSDRSKLMRAAAARTLGELASERGRKPLEELLKREKEPLVLAEANKSVAALDKAAKGFHMDMDLIMDELNAR